MVLDALQRRQRRGGVRLRDPLMRSLDPLRSRRNLPASLAGRDRFQDTPHVLGLVPDLVRDPTALDSFPCAVSIWSPETGASPCCSANSAPTRRRSSACRVFSMSCAASAAAFAIADVSHASSTTARSAQYSSIVRSAAASDGLTELSVSMGVSVSVGERVCRTVSLVLIPITPTVASVM